MPRNYRPTQPSARQLLQLHALEGVVSIRRENRRRQIYFPEKLQRICDAYRNEQKEHGRFSDAAVSYALQTYNRLSARFPKLFPTAFWTHNLSKKIVRAYERYVFRLLSNEKPMLTVSGINLFHDGNEWSVCLGDRDGVLPPFNGVGDTVFFEISPQTYFVPFELPHAGADNRYASSYIETMRKPAQRMLYGGFYGIISPR